MSSFIHTRARDRLESKLLCLTSIPAAKQTVPYTVARLERWCLLIDSGVSIPFKPYIPQAEELKKLEDPPLSAQKIFRLSPVVGKICRPPWWKYLSPQCDPETPAADDAWRFCASRLYVLFNAAISGNNEGLLSRIAAAEKCLP